MLGTTKSYGSFFKTLANNPFITATTNDSQVIASLDGIIDRVKNPTPFLRRANELILLQIDRGFEQQKSPSGEPWKPNTPYTIAQKRSKGRILKVLQSTGRGRAEVHGQVVGNKLYVGTILDYMRKQQLGIGVPKREYIGISKQTADELIAMVDEFVTKE